MEHIALFGTSADPPTAGHATILRWLAHHYDHVAVWASDNPMKAGQTPLEHRMEMLGLVVQDLQRDCSHVHLYPDLSQRRTLHTVERARQRWPGAQFDFVIGSDLLAQLPQWYHVDELLQQVRLRIMPRPGYPIDGEPLAVLQDLGADYAIADCTPPAVSSSHYRQEGDRTAILPPVAAYIDRTQLYAS
ncbi:nicotinate-nucleotide adenylyltransferase [Spirulina major]|uniref:nicotinate-nucleotide adenylyltransferase n=1 Tax=Spirulina major TaxID=270636 RepID=UPI000A02695B|nr:nicotinate-nucleotide adenylyltransferase [Spirulina major]